MANDTGNRADDRICYICLGGATKANPLARPCPCPRDVHPVCLARWQLRCAGKEQEKECRFCKNELPDWRSQLPPVSSTVEIRVVCGGKTHRLTARPEDTYHSFQEHVWQTCGLQKGTPLELSFNFNDPFTGDAITCKGSGAYGAAVHCGALTSNAASSTSRKPSSKSTTVPCRPCQPSDSATSVRNTNQTPTSSAPPPAPVFSPASTTMRPDTPPPPPTSARRVSRNRTANYIREVHGDDMDVPLFF
eukprot:CAMPEP_0197859630 /NCGR_PEP_ID=MMETSP1438-20131217/34359_1 /TAXON_ID=1461541 /ORGANISM="Pterosperma sp., Strain CCMP1384" /LENGTH=247 /DNA_ID=CAMNT_0043476193 /DNA_START=242 /DNA_END=985 /DNA_ORIENTATION=+